MCWSSRSTGRPGTLPAMVPASVSNYHHRRAAEHDTPAITRQSSSEDSRARVAPGSAQRSPYINSAAARR